HHEDAKGNGERPARTTLADDGTDERHPQLRHHVEVAADRLGLPALFRSDPRIRPRRIDEAQARDAEPCREPHEPHGLAVAFRAGHAEVPENLLLGIASLLVADQDHRLPVETGETSDDRGIVGERAVAVRFLEVRKQSRDVIERVRTLRMPRHLSDLPRRELSVDLLGERGALFLQALDLLGDVGRRVLLREAQLLDFRLELGDRLLELQKRRFHRQLPGAIVPAAGPASSSISAQAATCRLASTKWRASPPRYSALRPDRPQPTSFACPASMSCSGSTRGARATTRAQMLAAALTEICWPTIERARVK